MDGFNVRPVEGLRSPLVVMAFTGWSDTGTVTTDVAQHLIDTFDAEQFLDVEAEEYFVFTDTRPNVVLDERGVRSIEWPVTEAYAARVPAANHDLVIVKGAEPNLRWGTFAQRLSETISTFDPSLVCTLVARPAATPHTRPVPVTGSSADPALAGRYGLGRSMYQGPTGIVGVTHDSMRAMGMPLISLAAGVPHYLNVEENPPATVALLRALERFIGAHVPTGDLEEDGEAFVSRVDEASSGDEQIAAYVRSLEEQYQEQQPGFAEDEESSAEPGELPSADDVLRDVEDLLRGNGDEERE